MPTYEQREFAGLNTVSKQDIPVDKHALKQEKDEEHALALEQKKIRLLNDDNHKMMEYKRALTVTFGSPRGKIMEQINAGNCMVISEEEAMCVPRKRAA